MSQLRPEARLGGTFGGRQRDKRTSYADPTSDGILRGLDNPDFHENGEFVCYKPPAGSSNATMQITDTGESFTDYEEGRCGSTAQVAAAGGIVALVVIGVTLAVALPLALSNESRRSATYQPPIGRLMATGSQRETNCGVVHGSEVKRGIFHFSGIPYAMPLAGHRLLLRAQPVVTQLHCAVAWRLSFQQRQQQWHRRHLLPPYSPTPLCLQQRENSSDLIGQADCLHLDVWTPAAAAGDNLPTVVLLASVLHTFSPQLLLSVPPDLVSATRAVYVVPRHRLGPLGFFTHEQLNADAASGLSGNMAMSDIAACLRWVQNNIHNFGASPQRVTLLGFNSGASLALNLALSGTVDSLYQQLWISSPALNVLRTLPEAEQIDVKYSSCMMASCRNSLNVSEFTASVDWATLDSAQQKDFFDLPPIAPTSPIGDSIRRGHLVIDGNYVVDSPLSLIGRRRLSKPLVIGSMQEDSSIFTIDPVTPNWSPSHLEIHIDHRLSAAGVNASGTGAAASALYMKLGRWTEATPMLHKFAQLVTDIRLTCPLREFSANVTTSKNFYRYIMTDGPQQPQQPYHWNQFPLTSAFSTLDALILLGTPGVAEAAVVGKWRQRLEEFLHDGQIPSWRTFQSGSVLNFVSNSINVTHRIDTMTEICNFWGSKFLTKTTKAWYS